MAEHLTRNEKVVGSIPTSSSKKKDMTFGHVFLFGFRPPEAASTLRDFNARGGKAAPAPRFSPTAKTLVRRTRAAAQKGRWVVFLQRSCQSKISILTIPSQIKGHLQSRCPFIWGSATRRAAPPFGISMLGAAKPPLRQGFRLRRKRLYGAPAPPARRPDGCRPVPLQGI